MKIRVTLLLISASTLMACACSSPTATEYVDEATSPSRRAPKSALGTCYVTANEAPVRVAPRSTAPITNVLYRQQRVEVSEVQGKWARVSEYYNGRAEGLSGPAARWVSTSHLARTRPDDLQQPEFPDDPRIDGLPNVGDHGLTQRDVQVLYAAALYYLESERFKRIEYGDKSTHRPGFYYLNSGGPTNHFFRPQDIPDLEQRIRRLRSARPG